LDRAVEELESHTDFKMDHRAYHDILMLRRFVHLELHFSIKENADNIDRVLSRAWEYAELLGEGHRYVFSPEFQIFHIVAHMSYHFLHGGLGVRPFLDLWLLRNKTEYDEEQVEHLCWECGILKFYEECCSLANAWRGNGEYTETAELLEQFCLSGGVFGNREFGNAARQREHRGFNYILSRVFPSIAQVREYYSESSDDKQSSAYFYEKDGSAGLKEEKNWEDRSARSCQQISNI